MLFLFLFVTYLSVLVFCCCVLSLLHTFILVRHTHITNTSLFPFLCGACQDQLLDRQAKYPLKLQSGAQVKVLKYLIIKNQSIKSQAISRRKQDLTIKGAVNKNVTYPKNGNESLVFPSLYTC